MSSRMLALYSAAILFVLVVLMVVHRYVGRLAPAPPVDISNVPLSIAPIPVPAEAAPTILHSQPDDFRDAVARRPQEGHVPPPFSPAAAPVSDLPPDDTLLVPIPPGKP